MKFVLKPDAASFLPHINQHAAAFLRNHLHGGVKLVAAVAARGTEDVSRQTLTVNTHKNRVFSPDIPADQCKMRRIVDLGTVEIHLEITVSRRQFDGFLAHDQMFRAAAVGNQVRNGKNFEPVLLFEFHQLRRAISPLSFMISQIAPAG